MNLRALLAGICFLACEVALAANQAPTVNITAPAAGSPPLASPATVTIKANASDSDGTITKVQFFQGTTQIGGDDTVAPYEVTHTFTTAGTYSLTAKATDNGNKTTTSAAVQIQVIVLTTTITAPANNSVIQGRSVGVSGAFTGGDTTTVIATAAGGHSTLANLSGSTYGATVALAPGANTIEVQVARRDGTSETASVNVTAVDPPVIAYTAPTSCRAYRVGDSETFAVDAASAQGAIAEVRFFDNGAQVGPTLTAPPFSADITFTAVGNHSITARATDTFGFTATSSALNLNVATAAPVATVSSPTNGQRFRAGAPVTLTATASDSDGSVSSLHYFANSGGGDIRVEGGTTAPYQATWTPPTHGTYTIRAVAVDNTNVEGTSASISIAVNRAPSVTVTSPENGAQFTAPATIVVSADASDLDGGSITKVQFMRGATLIEEKTAPPYQSTVPNLAAGNYQFSAIAFDNDGDSTQSAVVSVTVSAPPNQAPTIALTSPATGASFTAPTDITLSATASDADGAVEKVEFFDGTSLLATVTSAPYSYVWSNAGLGSHIIEARATDNLGAATSVTATVTVSGTLVSITQPANGATYAAPATYQIVADVATSSGTITKVEFLDGADVKGLAENLNITAATIPFTYSNVGAGSHLHTVRVTHSSGPTFVSSAVTVAVSIPPSVSLTSPISNETFVAPGAVGLTAVASAFPQPIASVQFYAGAQLVGEDLSSPYEILWNNVASGVYQIYAKATDTAGNVAQSAAMSIKVVAQPSLQIDPGQDGMTVADDNVFLSGRVDAPLNSTVLVNDRPATLDATGAWFINRLPLVSGANAVSIVVSTIGAPDVTASVVVNSSGVAPCDFGISPSEGLPGQNVVAVVTERGALRMARVEFDADGDGSSDATVTQFRDRVAMATFSYPASGTYSVGVRIFDDQELLIYSSTRKLLIGMPAHVGNIVASVYRGMIARLLNADAAGAVEFISHELQERYRNAFISLGPNLSSVVPQLGTSEVRAVTGEIGQIVVLRGTGGSSKAFPIFVIKGVDGLWRIDSL